MASDDPDAGGVITRQLLKSKSGEFDIESIHTVSLKDLGIYDLGCISECSNLERLDVSCNDLVRLHKLAGLMSLTSLNLSANRIIHLDGLQSLESLKTLNVAGNLIGSVDALRCLGSLENLTSVRVRDDLSGLTNPMCNSSYTDEVLAILPKLLNLDGKRVRGKGSELFQLCQYMDRALSNMQAPEASAETNLSETAALHVPPELARMLDSGGHQVPVPVTEAEESLRELLGNCRVACVKADELFKTETESLAKQRDSSR